MSFCRLRAPGQVLRARLRPALLTGPPVQLGLATGPLVLRPRATGLLALRQRTAPQPPLAHTGHPQQCPQHPAAMRPHLLPLQTAGAPHQLTGEQAATAGSSATDVGYQG
jgi:hypothetical protein